MKQAIYLDYAAATPMDPAVQQAMRPFLTEQFYNPSATYLAAGKVKQALDQARARIGHWLGAKSSEIIFTAGGTEANNLAIHGIMKQFPDGNIVISAIEHDSVRVPASQYDCRQSAVTADGRIDLDDLRAKIDDRTVLVSIMYANNEIGTVQSLREVAAVIDDIREQRGSDGLPIYLHTDACQAANYLDLHVARLGVDLLTLNGGKIYGPKQSAVLYVKAGLQLQPIISGGGQERNLRSGTENVAAAVGLATALDLVQTDRQAEVARLQALQKLWYELLEPTAAVTNGSTRFRLPNNIHLTLPGSDNERLLMQLDEVGIMAAAGSACSASHEEASHVLEAIGLDEQSARASLRFTMGRQTTDEMIRQTVARLRQLT